MAFDRPDLRYLVDDSLREAALGEAAGGPLGLDDGERAILAAVLMAPVSWSPLAVSEVRKPERLKMLRKRRIPPPEAEAWVAGLAASHDRDVVDRLIESRWLDPWTVDGDRLVTLSVPAARRLGVTLFDPWDDGFTQWTLPGDIRFRFPIRLRQVRQGATAQDDDALLLNLVDTAPSPEQDAIDAEEYLMRQKVDPETGKPLIDLHTGEAQKEAVMILGAMVKLSRAKRARSGKKGKGKGKKSKAKKAKAT